MKKGLLVLIIIASTLLLSVFTISKFNAQTIIKETSSPMTESPLKLKIGDCLTFKDSSLRQFGFTLIKLEKIGPNIEYAFAPIKLDTTQVGIDAFLKGQVYVGEFVDWNSPTKKGYGFPVYHFLDEKNFNQLYSEFEKIANIKIDEKYLSISGGTVAKTIKELKTSLTTLDIHFGFMSKQKPVESILKN